MGEGRELRGCWWKGTTLVLARCAWACALLAAAVGAHPDVDTSTGLGENTLTNSGMNMNSKSNKSIEILSNLTRFPLEMAINTHLNKYIL